MPMTLTDFPLAVNPVSQRVRLDLASPGAQTHGTSKFLHAAQFAQLVNHAMRRRRIEFAGVCLRQSNHVAGKFNAGSLHAQTDAEVRNLFLPGITDSDQHPLDTAFAKTTRDENSVVTFELSVAGLVASLQPLSLNPIHLQLKIVRQRAVYQRLLQRLVGILVLDVFTDNADGHRILRVVNTMNNIRPLGEIAVARLQVEVFQDQRVDTLIREHKGNLVDGSHVFRSNDGLFSDVAKQ